MDLFIPPVDGNQDRGPAVRSFYWTGFAICFTLLCLRFWARIKIRSLGWDDWIMALAVTILLALTTTGEIMTLKGACKHVYYLLIEGGTGALVEVAYLFYIVQPLAIMCIAVSRTSVAVLVLRILGPRNLWRKWFLWFSIVSTLVLSTLTSIVIFAACKPVAALWNPFIPAHCWNPNIATNLKIFTSVWNVFMDVCFAVIPVTIFWNLNLSLSRRVALSFLMGMGILAGICGAFKASKLYESIQIDFTWEFYDLLQWNGAETFLIIICGCLPTFKPLCDSCLGHIRQSTTVGSGPRALSRSRKSYFWFLTTKSDTFDSPSPVTLDASQKPEVIADLENEIRVVHQIDIDVSAGELGSWGDSNGVLSSRQGSVAVPNWEKDGVQRPVYKTSWHAQGRTHARLDDAV